jgi:hypothetical protein
MTNRRSSREKRDWALDQKPVHAHIVKEASSENELRVTVKLERPRWQQVLGAPRQFTREYILDSFGKEVYQECDGRKKVSTIIEDFATRHKVSHHEASLAVTTFLKTLITKRLVIISVREGKE